MTNVLSDGELRTLWRVVSTRQHGNAVRDVALFGVLCNTGLRPGEAVRLRVGDLRPDADSILVETLKRRDHVRDQPVPAFVMARLALLGGARNEPLFRTRKGGALTVRALQHLWTLYARMAGIRGRTLYSLRHTYATRILESGGSAVAVRDLLGHARLSSTDRYVTLRDAKAAAAAVPPVGLEAAAAPRRRKQCEA
jgi:integrase/recombinase XerC